MSALVDEGRLLLALADPQLAAGPKRVMEVLADDNPPITLDGLCARLAGVSTPRWVFYAVGLLEERGWITQGLIR